jgi:hypothetical protein
MSCQGKYKEITVRFLCTSGSPQAFSPRDDKVWSGMVVYGSVTTHTLCHCEKGGGADDAAIHRVSNDANDLSLRFLVHSGSPRAFSPRDDKAG